MPQYLARWTAPVLTRTGETGYEDGRPVKWHAMLAWPTHGVIEAKDAQQALFYAKAEWGGSPVIEEMQEPVHYL